MRHRRKCHELKLDPAMILPVKTMLNGGVGWEDALKQDVAAIICFPAPPPAVTWTAFVWKSG